MKRYVGTPPHGVRVESVDGGVITSRPLPLHERHSPTGYSWGYEGSGPAQLALDLLWDVFAREPNADEYQQFKREMIAVLDGSQPWEITEEQVWAWARTRRAHRAQR